MTTGSDQGLEVERPGPGEGRSAEVKLSVDKALMPKVWTSLVADARIHLVPYLTHALYGRRHVLLNLKAQLAKELHLHEFYTTHETSPKLKRQGTIPEDLQPMLEALYESIPDVEGMTRIADFEGDRIWDILDAFQQFTNRVGSPRRNSYGMRPPLKWAVLEMWDLIKFLVKAVSYQIAQQGTFNCVVHLTIDEAVATHRMRLPKKPLIGYKCAKCYDVSGAHWTYRCTNTALHRDFPEVPPRPSAIEYLAYHRSHELYRKRSLWYLLAQATKHKLRSLSRVHASNWTSVERDHITPRVQEHLGIIATFLKEDPNGCYPKGETFERFLIPALQGIVELLGGKVELLDALGPELKEYLRMARQELIQLVALSLTRVTYQAPRTVADLKSLAAYIGDSRWKATEERLRRWKIPIVVDLQYAEPLFVYSMVDRPPVPHPQYDKNFALLDRLHEQGGSPYPAADETRDRVETQMLGPNPRVRLDLTSLEELIQKSKDRMYRNVQSMQGIALEAEAVDQFIDELQSLDNTRLAPQILRDCRNVLNLAHTQQRVARLFDEVNRVKLTLKCLQIEYAGLMKTAAQRASGESPWPPSSSVSAEMPDSPASNRATADEDSLE